MNLAKPIHQNDVKVGFIKNKESHHLGYVF
jgi:hypothetical protein